MRINLRTKSGNDFYNVASWLQKGIRRADARVAGYCGIDLFESGYYKYVWLRLLTISAEDCYGIITKEIWSLYEAWRLIDSHKKGDGRIFAAKAVLIMCQAPKSRDADHVTCLSYDVGPDDDVNRSINEVRESSEKIPDYALDCHTRKGKAAGLTKEDFFPTEHNALRPRQPGLFDNLAGMGKTKSA